MNRPKCSKCGRTMVSSEDGVSYYCPVCYEYVSRENDDEWAEKKLGA